MVFSLRTSLAFECFTTKAHKKQFCTSMKRLDTQWKLNLSLQLEFSKSQIRKSRSWLIFRRARTKSNKKFCDHIFLFKTETPTSNRTTLLEILSIVGKNKSRQCRWKYTCAEN